VIVAFDPNTGQPAAVLDSLAITVILTGTCSAHCRSRFLGHPAATVLAIRGTGAGIGTRITL
jgi:alanine dehydrogenase